MASYKDEQTLDAVHIDVGYDIGSQQRHATVDPDARSAVAFMGRLGIDNTTAVEVYDDAGNYWLARFWRASRYCGYDDVRLLDGGLAKWALEGRPLQQGVNEVMLSTFRADVRPTLLATKADVLSTIDDHDVAIIDSLQSEYYSGEMSWPDMRAGHIRTAENVFVMDNLDPVDMTLLPAQSLIDLWQKVDLKPDQEVITYCGVGYNRALNLFVLYQLGYDDVRLYDGAWMEWGVDPTLPVGGGASE